MDKFTGEGIANAAVIVVDRHVVNGGFPFSRNSVSFSYRDVTHTDANGNFRSKTHFFDLEAGSYMPCTLFRWKCEDRVFITAFKPGYAATSAVPLLPKDPPPVGERFFDELSQETWIGTGALMLDASPQDMWVLARYYRAISNLANPSFYIGADVDSEVVRFIKEPAHQYLTTQVCHLYPEDELSSDEVRDATDFIDDGWHKDPQMSKWVPSQFVRDLYAIQPDGFDLDRINYKPTYSRFRAGTICDLMHKIGVSK